MRIAKLAHYLLAVGAAVVGAQQPSISNPVQPPPSSIIRDPHSTNADFAVPLCPASFNDRLATNGVLDKFADGATPPVLKKSADAQFSEEARHQKRKGRITHFEAVLSFVVNTDGEPQNICLMRSTGYGLDAKAAEAVQKYKFAPATKDGKPVAARLHVQVDFNLHFGLF